MERQKEKQRGMDCVGESEILYAARCGQGNTMNAYGWLPWQL